jgi:hypothetical protein
MQTKTKLKKNVVNLFGTLAYLFCTLQWLWAIMLNLSLIEGFVSFVSPRVENHVVPPTTYAATDSSMSLITVVIVIAALVVLLTGYVLVKMPSAIVKTEKKVVHETAENVAPVILRIQHKEDTAKSQRKITLRIIIAFKMLLIIAPVILFFTPQSAENRMIDSSIAMYVSLWLACLSVVLFAFQYSLASFLSVSKRDIW